MIRKQLIPCMVAPLPFEGKIAGYVTNHLEMWKYEPLYSRDDMMQEATVVWLKCAQEYPHVVSKHFMALFKTAWYRRCVDMAYDASECRKQIGITFGNTYGDEDETIALAAEPIGEDENAGYMRTLVRQITEQAPEEVLSVISLMLNAPAELLELASNALGRRNKNNTNMMVARCLGMPDDSKPVDEAKKYVRNAVN